MPKWFDYIDSQLLPTGAVEEAMIMGKYDGQVWGATKDFCPRVYMGMVTNDDGTETETELNEAGILTATAKTLEKQKEGFRLNGTKYMVVRTYPNGSEDDGLGTMYFKKAKSGGVMVVLSRCVIIGTYDEKKGQAPPSCYFAVERLGRYLLKAGF